MELFEYMPFRIFVSILAFILGASIGSFSSCMAYRLFSKEGIGKRSYCEGCGALLKLLDLIPVFSYLLLRGRCRKCGAKIGIHEFVIELICGGLLCIAYIRNGFDVGLYVFIGMLLVLSFASSYDLYSMQIPNAVHACIFIFWVVLIVFSENKCELLIDSCIGGLLIPLVVFLISFFIKKTKHQDSLGFGDVKLIAATGLVLGAYRSLLNLLLMCVLGLIYVVLTKTKKGEKFPFAPCISLSTAICYIFGGDIINAYLEILR